MKIQVKSYETMFGAHHLSLRMEDNGVSIEPKITNKSATMHALICAAMEIRDAGGQVSVSEFKNFIHRFLTEQQKKQLIGELILKI